VPPSLTHLGEVGDLMRMAGTTPPDGENGAFQLFQEEDEE
jgi:hypothetical protein